MWEAAVVNATGRLGVHCQVTSCSRSTQSWRWLEQLIFRKHLNEFTALYKKYFEAQLCCQVLLHSLLPAGWWQHLYITYLMYILHILSYVASLHQFIALEFLGWAFKRYVRNIWFYKRDFLNRRTSALSVLSSFFALSSYCSFYLTSSDFHTSNLNECFSFSFIAVHVGVGLSHHITAP